MSETVKRDVDSRFKQRAVIEFLTHENVRPIEIHRRLQAVFGAETLDISKVRYWVRMANSGPVPLFDQPRAGRPKLRRSGELKHQIEAKIRENRRITQRQLANEAGIALGTVNKMINELGFRRICAKWVPKLLTVEIKAARKAACEELLARYYREGERFLLNIVTGDESWICHYDPELKDQSMEYRHQHSPRQKKIRTERATGKLMFTVFWDSEGVIHRQFLPKGTTINSARYIKTLEALRRRLKRVRGHHPVYLLQHDNARPHTSNETSAAIERLGFEVLVHPPYSPDLAPSDFYLFRHLKRHLKGNRYSCDAEMQAAVSFFLRKMSREFYETGMRKLISRWIRCIASNGDYVEV